MSTVNIDCGKHTTKVKFKEKMINFDSKVDLGKSQFGGNSYTSIVNNISYIVGNEASTYDMSLTKNTEHHKILIYTAIANVIDNESKIDLILGTPLALFFNEDDKNEYIERISNNGMPISVNINGVQKYFSIDKCIIAPETLGGSLLDFNDSKKVIRGVLDEGGLNFNGLIYDKGRPIRDSLITKNKGSHILETDLKQDIAQKTGKLLEDYVLKDYLIRGCKNKDMQKIIDDHCLKFLNDIKNECLKKNWDLDEIELYFMGGCSILLEKYIREVFKNPVFANDIYANVKAFEIFGMSKLNGKK